MSERRRALQSLATGLAPTLAACGARTELFAPQGGALDAGSLDTGSVDAALPDAAAANDAMPTCGASGQVCCGGACIGGLTCSGGVCAPGALLLFGGSTSRFDFNDTWTFMSTNWTQLTVSNPPSARGGPVMATLGNQVVLFGGDSVGDMNDTWTFGGTSWTQVTVSARPPVRYAASSARLGNRLVLFGGYTEAVGPMASLNDTWTFDGTSWTQVSVSNPPSPRGLAAMATLGNQVVLFGGTSITSSAPLTTQTLNDTWTFDGANWTQVSISNAPSAREWASMATLGSQVVLYGGQNVSVTVFDDTWTFDGTTWSEVSVAKHPPQRNGPSVASLGGEIVLFGGVSIDAMGNVILHNDTWTFNGSLWNQVTDANPPPPGRSSAGMAFLP